MLLGTSGILLCASGEGAKSVGILVVVPLVSGRAPVLVIGCLADVMAALEAMAPPSQGCEGAPLEGDAAAS